MLNTKYKSTLDHSIYSDKNRGLREKIVRFLPAAKFKTKQILIERMKAIGEELLAWILTISTVAVLIQLFLSLH